MISRKMLGITIIRYKDNNHNHPNNQSPAIKQPNQVIYKWINRYVLFRKTLQDIKDN